MAEYDGKLIIGVDIQTEETKKELNEVKNSLENTAKVSDSSTSKISKGFSNIKDTIVKLGIGTAVVKIGKDIIDATNQFEVGRQAIVNATGATGEALDSLVKSSQDAFIGLEQSFEEVSRGIGELNTRFGLTGEALTEATRSIGDFADVTGQDMQVAVQGISQTMNQWNLETSEMNSLLDKLTVAGQISGVSVGQLSAELTDGAGTLKAMGYSLDEAIAMLSNFEKNGLNASQMMMGMKQSFAQSAKAGTDARKDWDKLMYSIANATTEAEANSIAIEVFGNRVGTTMVTALKDGKLNFDEFTVAIQNSEGALASADETGETTADKIQHLKNEFAVLAGNLGESLVPIIETVIDTIGTLKPIIEALVPLIQTIGSAIELVLDILNPVISAIAELTNAIAGGLFNAISKVKDFFKLFVKDTKETGKTAEKTAETTGKKVANTVDKTTNAVEKSEKDLLSVEKQINDESVISKQNAEETKLVATEDANSEMVNDTVSAYDQIKYYEELHAQRQEQLLEQQKAQQQAYADAVERIYQGLNTNIGDAFNMMFKDIMDNGKISIESFEIAVASAYGVMGDCLVELGRSLVTEGDAWGNMGKIALQALSSILQALGEEMAARAVLAAFTLNWSGAAALTAGSVAAFVASGVVSGLASKLLMGKEYVPYDNYPASLHRGEMVLTKDDAEKFRDIGGLYGLEKSLSPSMNLDPNGIRNSVNVNNQLSAIIEVDGTQLGVAVLKNIDNARQFVMGV